MFIHAVLSFVVLTKTRLGFRFLLLFVCYEPSLCVFLSSVRFCFIVFNSDEVVPFVIENIVFCL